MDDAEQVGALLLFVVRFCEEVLGLDAQHLGKRQDCIDAGGVGAGFETADGLGVEAGPFGQLCLGQARQLAVAAQGDTQS